MQLTFNSIEEVREFIKSLKGTRGGKGGDDSEGTAAVGAVHQAPAPIQPPVSQPGAFAPAPQSTAFPSAPAFSSPSGVAPEIQAVVGRIVTRTDALIAGGQPADAILNWFRGECTKAGQDASSATLDQIKTVILPKLSQPLLENFAKLIGA